MKFSPLKMIPIFALAWSVQGLDAQETETEQAVEAVQAYEATGTIAEIAGTREDLTIFQEAMEIAGLTETLGSEGPYTIFVPTNDAFAALPEGQMEWLVENPEELKKVLLNHVVDGVVSPAEMESIETLAGETLAVHIMGDELVIGSATVDGAVLPATNGQVFVINSVLVAADTQDR